MKNYKGLTNYTHFNDRLKYLKLDGSVGKDTFGFDRYLNQNFYKSKDWKMVRDFVIARDGGNDLGILGMPIRGTIIIHHIEPINPDDIVNATEKLLDPNNLICTSLATHNAIHFGDEHITDNVYVERTRNDTCPWKK